MQEEIWKDIEGYEGKYQISNLGNVKSLSRKITTHGKSYRILPERIISPKKVNSYLSVILYDSLSCKSFKIHRLVAQAFIHNPNNYPQVNHIDGNKENNCVDNLEWCTQSYNMKEAYRIGLQKPRKFRINQYDLHGNFIKTWDSIKSIELYYNNRHISDCCKGKRNKASNYIWRYAD